MVDPIPPAALQAELLIEMTRLRTRLDDIEAMFRASTGGSIAACRMADIIVMAEALFEVRTADLISTRRDKLICRARFAVMWVARQALPYSLPMIGRALGNRDHTTIMSGIRQADRLRKRDIDFLKATDAMLAEAERQQEIAEREIAARLAVSMRRRAA